MIIQKPSLRAIYLEVAGFSLIIIVSWMDELVNLSNLIFGGTHVPDFNEAIFETIVTLFFAIPTIFFTWNITKRLHYLEGYLRICAWCKKVAIDDQWISTEEFFDSHFNTMTSHGMCPICAEKMKSEF